MNADKPAKDTVIPAGPLGVPNPIDIYLGRRVRELREDAEITQRDFAEQLGISDRQLRKFEYGTEKIPASLLWYIAAILEEDLDVFFKDILPSKASRHYKVPKPSPLIIE